jgi:hypothetical protein
METVAAEVGNDRLVCKAIFQLDSASHNIIIYLIFIRVKILFLKGEP